MKRFVLALILFLCTTTSYSQNLSYLEIWGLPEDISKEDLIRQLKKTPYGVSQRGLKMLGYTNAYNFMTSDGQFIILRDYPAYDFIPKIQFANVEVHEIWQDVIQSDLLSMEGMSSAAFYEVYKEEGIEGLTEVIQDNNDNYSRFRLKLDEEKVVGLCALYEFVDQMVSQEEVLKILRHSQDEALREAAASLAFLFMHSHEDALKFMPFLYSGQSDKIETQLVNFYRNKQIPVDWGQNIDFYCQLLNHPNPYLVARLLAVMDQSNFKKELLTDVLNKGTVTLLEILKSENALDLQDRVMFFLNKYSTKNSYGFDKKKWIQLIEQQHELQAQLY